MIGLVVDILSLHFPRKILAFSDRASMIEMFGDKNNIIQNKSFIPPPHDFPTVTGIVEVSTLMVWQAHVRTFASRAARLAAFSEVHQRCRRVTIIFDDQSHSIQELIGTSRFILLQ